MCDVSSVLFPDRGLHRDAALRKTIDDSELDTRRMRMPPSSLQAQKPTDNPIDRDIGAGVLRIIIGQAHHEAHAGSADQKSVRTVSRSTGSCRAMRMGPRGGGR